MGQLIDFKTKKIIKKFVEPVVEDDKQLSIEFLEGIIDGLKKDKINPEKCIVIFKWKRDDESEAYEMCHNQLKVETILSSLKLCEDLFIKDICS